MTYCRQSVLPLLLFVVAVVTCRRVDLVGRRVDLAGGHHQQVLQLQRDDDCLDRLHCGNGRRNGRELEGDAGSTGAEKLGKGGHLCQKNGGMCKCAGSASVLAWSGVSDAHKHPHLCFRFAGILTSDTSVDN